jgi:tetratricopeptide (TPR) repeat protein
MVGRYSVFFLVAVILIAAIAYWQPRPLTYMYEDVRLLLQPSAERAYAYGDRHFDALHADRYDIDRAERLYKKAEAIDSDLPALQHQLARIEFLNANFHAGLERINREIAAYGEKNPNAYYIRALILGYQGKYLEAAADYETYFKIAPANWAAINDYSWVLLKAELPEAALEAIEWGLVEWPDNPWLLHNKVIAFYELGRYEEAMRAAEAATAAVDTLSREGWLLAYPGNDPLLADEGLASFKQAVRENQKKVQEAIDTSK